ncbi:substrate-binding domain-containing protein [Streptomyces sp. NPDC003717]|uniref:substrate-binding domain-containing protein n=1 Tax=Streptomyces sp. NPDC003717 TaxID=3154276 RepID=UPI0033BC2A4E
MRLHVNQRHARVLELVRARGSLRMTELAEALGVSAVTVRRDVEALAGEGRLLRAHGAVTWPGEGGLTAGAAPSAPPAAPQDGMVLGMVVPSMEHYFAELAHGAREAVAARGGRLVLGISNYLPGQDPVQVGLLLDAGAQGLLLQPSWERGLPTAEQERQLLDLPVPAVLMERRIPPGGRLSELDGVRSDHVLGGAAAVHHLADLGRERVALLVRKDSPTAPLVQEGYEAALTARGLTPSPPLEMHPAADPAGYDDAVARLTRRQDVEAVIVHNDQDAIAVAQRLRAAGLRIPEDMAMVAYEDELAGMADVPLTAVAPPRRAVGRMAAELLTARLPQERAAAEEDSPRRHVALLPRLRVRESTVGRADH